jgi:hypothetical protein
MAYFAAVLEAGAELAGDFEPDVSGVDGTVCRERAAAGRALLEPGEFRVDGRGFDLLFERLVALTKEHRGLFGEELDLPSLPEGGNGWSRELLSGLVGAEPDLSEALERAGGDPQLTAFLGAQALMPFLVANAWALRGLVEAASWNSGRCPVCGGAPVMARLEAEVGGRFLQCSLCLTEWSYKRLGCPACGIEDQERLRFFTDEKDETYRVDVCDACKAYLKTVDERKVDGEVCLPVDHLATIHLDLVAEREGYHRLGGGVPAGA